MGIIAKSASIGTIAIAPGGNLHTSIPFVELLLLRRHTSIHSILSPMAQAEFRACTQEFILHQQHIQETSCILIELLTSKALVVSYRVLILLASLVCKSLTSDIHQVELKVIVATILLCHTIHQSCSLLRICRIVIILHLRPRRCLEVIQRRTSAEDALVRALLIVASRTVIYTLGQNHPSLLNGGILHTITSLHVLLHPSLLGEFLWAPGQLTHQLEHHRIVF